MLETETYKQDMLATEQMYSIFIELVIGMEYPGS